MLAGFKISTHQTRVKKICFGRLNNFNTNTCNTNVYLTYQSRPSMHKSSTESTSPSVFLVLLPLFSNFPGQIRGEVRRENVNNFNPCQWMACGLNLWPLSNRVKGCKFYCCVVFIIEHHRKNQIQKIYCSPEPVNWLILIRGSIMCKNTDIFIYFAYTPCVFITCTYLYLGRAY